MSAIRVKCEQCGGHYIAGVVGSTPWPAHECPNATPLSLAMNPDHTIKLTDEQVRQLREIEGR